MNKCSQTKRRSLRAFSLVEMLMVLTIISVLSSLCALGMRALMGKTGLTGAGDRVSGLFAFARQEAIAHNTMTAVVLVTSPSTGSGAFRSFSVWELFLPTTGGAPTTSNWQQASKWQTLPSGIVVNSSVAASSFLNCASVTPALPTINYLGTSLNPSGGSDCVAQYFMPSGRLNAPPTDPCTLQLVEGLYNGSNTILQHASPSSPTLPANYVSYVFSTATGEPKIVRP